MTKMFTSGSRLNMRRWLFWGIGTYLMLEIGSFLALGFALKKTVGELACPYLACAMPCVIFMPLVWRLRLREEQGTPAKGLARGWGGSATIFGVAAVLALVYSAVALDLMRPMDAVGALVVSLLLGVPAFYFTAYYMTLSRISLSATRERHNGPKQ